MSSATNYEKIMRRSEITLSAARRIRILHTVEKALDAHEQNWDGINVPERSLEEIETCIRTELVKSGEEAEPKNKRKRLIQIAARAIEGIERIDGSWE